MALVYLVVLQRHLHLGRQLQQAQVVGNGGAALAHTLCHLVLCHALTLQQMLVGQCNLNVVEILALDVLYESHLHHVLVGDGAYVGRNGAETS